MLTDIERLLLTLALLPFAFAVGCWLGNKAMHSQWRAYEEGAEEKRQKRLLREAA